jgi:hypothetical protein
LAVDKSMVVKLSYKAQKRNSRLTDFEGLKDYVINNSVKAIPRTIKVKPDSDSLLSSF